jgi:hypothetical protein
MPTSKRISLFGVDIDAVTRQEAAHCILDWLRDDRWLARIVATPNTDHVIQYQYDKRLRSAYHAASLVVEPAPSTSLQSTGTPSILANRSLRTPPPGQYVAQLRSSCAQVQEGSPWPRSR